MQLMMCNPCDRTLSGKAVVGVCPVESSSSLGRPGMHSWRAGIFDHTGSILPQRLQIDVAFTRAGAPEGSTGSQQEDALFIGKVSLSGGREPRHGQGQGGSGQWWMALPAHALCELLNHGHTAGTDTPVQWAKTKCRCKTMPELEPLEGNRRDAGVRPEQFRKEEERVCAALGQLGSFPS